MSYAIEGWLPKSSPLALGRGGTPPIQASNRMPDQPGLWKYKRMPRSRGVMVFSVLISIGLHAFALLGFNDRAAPVRRVAVAEGPVIQMTMPELEEDKLKPVESLNNDEAMPDPGIVVPMLADLPTLVPVDSFVQSMDFTPTLPTNLDAVRLSAVPVNIARGSGTAERLGKIFDPSQLDRQPQAIIRPPPVFPSELKKIFAEAVVVLGFIISAKGEVFSPHVISSDNYRFEPAALSGVLKWRFKPGMKAGHAVNTRTEITITFRLKPGE